MTIKKHLKRSLFTVLVASLLLLSCKNNDFGQIEDFEGDWTVEALEIETYDNSGALVSDTTLTDFEQVSIRADQDKTGNFHTIAYDPAMSVFNPIATISFNGGGSTTTDGRDVVFCSPDLNNERIHFWGYTVYGYFTDVANIEKLDNKEMIISAAILFPTTDPNYENPTLHYLQRLRLKKK